MLHRYVLGGGARRLSGAAVLVSGLRGTGAQVAAALVLAGTGRVVLHDRGEASVADRAQQVPRGRVGVPVTGTGTGEGLSDRRRGDAGIGGRCGWGSS